ncbi:50S ribosomal protein L1, partial [Treponema pallidum]
DSAQIVENVDVFLSEMDRKKPVDVKAGFVRSISLSSSMGPGIWVVHKSEE